MLWVGIWLEILTLSVGIRQNWKNNQQPTVSLQNHLKSLIKMCCNSTCNKSYLVSTYHWGHTAKWQNNIFSSIFSWYSDHWKEGRAGVTAADCFITTHHAFGVICCYGDLLVLWGRGHSRAIRASTLISELQPQFVHLLHVSHCRGKKDKTQRRRTL